MPQVWEQKEINTASMGAGRDKYGKYGSRERNMPQVWEQREINAASMGADRDKCLNYGSRER